MTGSPSRCMATKLPAWRGEAKAHVWQGHEALQLALALHLYCLPARATPNSSSCRARPWQHA
jgi:hypothetical protein